MYGKERGTDSLESVLYLVQRIYILYIDIRNGD
nr:MAG TPA: hypothetical protein [Caudoviricetes sp.]